jgi:hypothetical protein
VTEEETALALRREAALRETAPAVQHDINNAMMVLAANLDLLARVAAEGAPRRQLDRAQEAMRRIEAASRGFLEAARRAPGVEAVSPAIALLRVLPLLRIVLGPRFGFDLAEPDQARGIWPVALDAARFDLAMLGLVRAAVDRMAPGARILAAAANRAATQEVALSLTLPEGAAPGDEAAALLGRLGARIEEGTGTLALVWPRRP